MPTTGTVKRVEIQGQFDPSNPWIAFKSARKRIRINREQLNNSNINNNNEVTGYINTPQPNNWNSFCDEADKILLQLERPKKIYYIISAISIFLFTLLIIGNFGFRLVFEDELAIPSIYYSIAYGLFVFTIVMCLIVAIWKIRTVLIQIFGQLEDVCQRYSVPYVVTYDLKKEWWGGCSKFNSARYYLNVNIYNNTNRDVEQQQQQQQQPFVVPSNNEKDNFVNQDSYSNTDTYNSNPPSYAPDDTYYNDRTTMNGNDTNNNNNSSSLFNQLSAGMN